ncbi:hypothetical protein GYA13_01240 [Candidatus Kuenenbacteria bacterium]|nr:hypothetical protein [Candidatus Kuenenbacteria bacterium]
MGGLKVIRRRETNPALTFGKGKAFEKYKKPRLANKNLKSTGVVKNIKSKS